MVKDLVDLLRDFLVWVMSGIRSITEALFLVGFAFLGLGPEPGEAILMSILTSFSLVTIIVILNVFFQKALIFRNIDIICIFFCGLLTVPCYLYIADGGWLAGMCLGLVMGFGRASLGFFHSQHTAKTLDEKSTNKLGGVGSITFVFMLTLILSSLVSIIFGLGLGFLGPEVFLVLGLVLMTFFAFTIIAKKKGLLGQKKVVAFNEMKTGLTPDLKHILCLNALVNAFSIIARSIGYPIIVALILVQFDLNKQGLGLIGVGSAIVGIFTLFNGRIRNFLNNEFGQSLLVAFGLIGMGIGYLALYFSYVNIDNAPLVASIILLAGWIFINIFSPIWSSGFFASLWKISGNDNEKMNVSMSWFLVTLNISATFVIFLLYMLEINIEDYVVISLVSSGLVLIALGIGWWIFEELKKNRKVKEV